MLTIDRIQIMVDYTDIKSIKRTENQKRNAENRGYTLQNTKHSYIGNWAVLEYLR